MEYAADGKLTRRRQLRPAGECKLVGPSPAARIADSKCLGVSGAAAVGNNVLLVGAESHTRLR